MLILTSFLSDPMQSINAEDHKLIPLNVILHNKLLALEMYIMHILLSVYSSEGVSLMK
jgi:hypothetical protein